MSGGDTPSDLVRNGHLIATAYHSLVKGAAGLDSLPLVLEEIGDKEMWRSFVHEATGQVFENQSFREFVCSSPPKGLGAKPETIERICYEHEAILGKIRVWLVGKRGAPIGNQNASKSIGNNVPNCPEDKGSRPARGNSKAYKLQFLEEHAPELHAAVLRGEISASRAMKAGGYRREYVQIPKDVEAAARRLAAAFDRAGLAALLAALTRYLDEAP